MARWFNIGGPCIAANHYMLPATARLPEVASLIRKQQYFVVHAPRQCGKTTGFLAFANEINAKGDAVALYCSLETAQEFPDPREGLPLVYQCICGAARRNRAFRGCPFVAEDAAVPSVEHVLSEGISSILSKLSTYAAKPVVVFFDEVDCLSEGTLVSFLRQLRQGRISFVEPNAFPVSVALIGMRDIRDYKAKIRPDSETMGSASPFNVITEAMTLRSFTEEELRALYRQDTDETGQVFEEAALKLAWEYSQGQPHLVNALARWCVEKIHRDDFSLPVTGAEMEEAKEKIVRERGTHLDSLMERMKEPRVRRVVEPVMLGGDLNRDSLSDDLRYVLDLGILVERDGALVPSNPMYAEIIGRYLSWGTQQDVRMKVQEAPWAKDDGLDMAGLMAAFQEFWRENADESAVPYDYREAYPQLVLQAFLQRVINGGGEIIREMALGKRAMDLGVVFRGAKYAVECKKVAFYEKSHEKAYDQVCGYMDRLGVGEGWLVVFDPDLSKPWDGKIYSKDVAWHGKTIHIIGC